MLFETLIFINQKKKIFFTFANNQDHKKINEYFILEVLFYVFLTGFTLEKRARIASAATNGVISPRVTRSS